MSYVILLEDLSFSSLVLNGGGDEFLTSAPSVAKSYALHFTTLTLLCFVLIFLNLNL